MGREMVAVDDIVTVREIADTLDVHVSTVQRWIERRKVNDFPVQLKKLRNVDLYNLTEVVVWFHGHKEKWGIYYGA